MSESKKFKSVPFGNIVNLSVSGAYMVRIHMLLEHLIELYGKESFMEFAKNIIDNKQDPKNKFEESLYTVISLITEFEKKAEEQNQVEEKEIPIESLSQQYPQSEQSSQ